MAEDLSRLKIDKSAQARRPSRRRAFLLPALILLAAVSLAALYLLGVLKPAASVQTATASFVYPSQNFTVLNASGYIVAQRKAAVASKATGRLTSLWVEEGSGAPGVIIAQLENDDAEASRAQAAANLSVSRASLNQAKTALEDAADYTATGGCSRRTSLPAAPSIWPKPATGAPRRPCRSGDPGR